MTDLPMDDQPGQRRQKTFNNLLTLKALNQANGRQRMKDWMTWYESLNEQERARVDHHLQARCNEISAQFGKPRRMPKL
ncbi:hypothetical protein [Pseudomonas sp. LP_7_YM]|uniref:hypothetical protein n=1 Tax=Pseudomonas sp. LP_7_YM TaxID=2485137 RepID=UPI001061BA20|nr:hypothetical protein [Pseudomonas sp. LP_7_YM]TDV58888.1 hypothetical protein EC915_1228 [Pseudomonas sp. LP_7_YM]